ncbi:MAG: hypothetical protein ACOC20_06395, partial [Oceanicaulis sp.]
MTHERAAREEIEAAARGAGCAGPDEVHSVILETGGSFSVITSNAAREDLRYASARLNRVRAVSTESAR